jgi:hypothetical protein
MRPQLGQPRRSRSSAATQQWPGAAVRPRLGAGTVGHDVLDHSGVQPGGHDWACVAMAQVGGERATVTNCGCWGLAVVGARGKAGRDGGGARWRRWR